MLKISCFEKGDIMSLLDKVNQPKDLEKLSVEELNILSEEIRKFLLDTVSKTGGHLASNLGVVELTLSLHKVFDFKEDKLIWDVGHQSYIHKILTGRKDDLTTIRQTDGISGFPKREESIYDVFDTGHSSTSISAAVGMARSRDLLKEKHDVVAVIGDGALTGGMAFEALNDIGKNQTKMIVILNDNEMSISENVGGLSIHLSRARTADGYISTKADVEKLLKKIPKAGKGIKKFLHHLKEVIKKMILPNMIFEELGITYLGPIDGHNISAMTDVFKRAKAMDEPVLIHVLTKKGKGYKYSEERPNDYHGVSKFDIETGQPLKKSLIPTYSEVFGKKMCELALDNSNLVAISAAMIDGTGLLDFQKKFSKRIFDIGIAEQHAVTMAAGMSASGMIPVVALYSSFLQRAYDQIFHDVCLQKLHAILAIDRAGIVGNDGETHQGVFDVGFLTQFPHMTVMAPADYNELNAMLDFAVNKFNAPIAIRYPRGTSEKVIDNTENKIVLGKGIVVKEGKDLTIIAYGKMTETAVNVAEILKEKNIEAEVVNLRFLKPLDDELLIRSSSKTGKVLIIEETSSDAGIHTKIKDILSKDVEILTKMFPDEYIKHGNTEDIMLKYRLDGKSISEDAISYFNFDNNYTTFISTKIYEEI